MTKPSDIGGGSVKIVVCAVALFVSAAAYGQYRSTPAANARTPSPSANPVNPVNVTLGKALFSDPRLSADQRLSCSTCHDPAHGFSDARQLSVGAFGRRGKRHTPTALGRGMRTSQGEAREFWDGRAATLEEQVLQPIVNPDELGSTVEAVLDRLHQDRRYRGLTRESLAHALAGYLRTVRSEDSPYDRFLAGRPNGLTDLELEGLRLFRDKARCYLCHSGTELTDESFHNTGVAWRAGVLQDEGRAVITGKSYHKGAFKTPTLREVGRRGPFMHDGSLATLEDVVEFYDRGGNQNPYLDENIVPLHLSDAEKTALLAFLRRGLMGAIVDGADKKGAPEVGGR